MTTEEKENEQKEAMTHPFVSITSDVCVEVCSSRHLIITLTFAERRDTAPGAIFEADSPSRAIEFVVGVALVLDRAPVVCRVRRQQPLAVGQRERQTAVDV